MTDRLEAVAAYLKKLREDFAKQGNMKASEIKLSEAMKQTVEGFAVFLEENYQIFTKSQKYEELQKHDA